MSFSPVSSGTVALFHLVQFAMCGSKPHHAAHSFTLAGDRKRAHVMQDIFGGDGFAPSAAFRQRHVFGDGFVEALMAPSTYQDVLQACSPPEALRVGRRWQDVSMPARS
jgi:hypothetical protein